MGRCLESLNSDFLIENLHFESLGKTWRDEELFQFPKQCFRKESTDEDLHVGRCRTHQSFCPSYSNQSHKPGEL